MKKLLILNLSILFFATSCSFHSSNDGTEHLDQKPKTEPSGKMQDRKILEELKGIIEKQEKVLSGNKKFIKTKIETLKSKEKDSENFNDDIFSLFDRLMIIEDNILAVVESLEDLRDMLSKPGDQFESHLDLFTEKYNLEQYESGFENDKSELSKLH